MYRTCTWAGAFTKERNRKPWCATSYTENANDTYFDEVLTWGDCKEGCPTEGMYDTGQVVFP